MQKYDLIELLESDGLSIIDYGYLMHDHPELYRKYGYKHKELVVRMEKLEKDIRRLRHIVEESNIERIIDSVEDCHPLTDSTN